VARGDWRVWLRIGAIGFGGPAGQIAVLQRELVDQRHWVTHDELTRAIALTSILPGPEAHQTATYIGLKRGGLRGALSAAVLFITPGALITALLAALYLTLGDVPIVAGALKGLQASVVVIIAAALIALGGRALDSGWLWGVAGASFVASFFFGVPFILVAALVATVGFLVKRQTKSAAISKLRVANDNRALPTGLALIGGVFALVAALNLLAEPDSRWGDLAWVLLISAFTLGGAYAIVDYATQALVIDYGWLSASDMSVGLGLGESTPGPLVLVIEFASFLVMAEQGPWQAVAGALIAVFVIFAVSTGLLLIVARFTDQIMGAQRLKFAMQAVSAAVVGVILSLGLAFALTTFFSTVDLAKPFSWVQVPIPSLASLAWVPILIAAIAAVLLFRLRLPIWQVVLACAGLGAVL
jgi:chromate transporter